MKTQKINTMKSVTRIAFFAILVVFASCKSKESSAQKKESGPAAKSEVKAPQVDIHTAVITDNLAALKQHISAGSNINEKDPYGGSSPLISAAVFGKKEAAKILIDAGADINVTNNDGSTALHSSAFFCRLEIVKMLLDKGANKTVKNKYGSTAYESVTGPYSEVKNVYEMMQQMLSPMGLKLDYAYIEKTRPVIAAMLK
ncbi:MAG: ankyrin repeat domain-containing protein [Bacteroidetes bacterium]|nr:ankyrin repeat domain-containing protein [Bacteroidota bacterium]MBI3483333.1 ankyrin repeat domain-containing protein [Bacteroidota bacterium]